MVGSGGFRGSGGFARRGAGLAGEWLRVEGLGGVAAAASSTDGDVPAQVRRHGLRHDQDGHPAFATLGLGQALSGRQTRIAIAALNLRQMLRPQ